jgi:hypothetical protein
MKHKHAENMMAYAQDAMETDKPWERWEMRLDLLGDGWTSLDCQCTWSINCEYRRKPRTISINGFDAPEPVRVPLKDGAEYFIPSLTSNGESDCHTWHGDEYDNLWLAKGIIHLTKEAAEIHAKALLSFTKTQP